MSETAGAWVFIGLLFWGVSGFIAGNIAKAKGRDQSGWFLAGLLLGPLGIVLAAIASPDQGVLDQEALRRGELRACPGCQELIKAEATKCRYCGGEVTPVPVEKTES